MDESLDEWVTHLAETRDMSEDEVVNQLVSAFWVLDEMNLLSDGGTPPREQSPRPPERTPPARDDSDESETAHGAAGTSSPDSASPTESPSEPDASSDSPASTKHDLLEDILDAAAATDEPAVAADDADPGTESSSPERPSPDVDPLDAISAASSDDDTPSVSSVIRTLAQLQRQVDDLALDLERQQSRQDQYADRITDNLTQIHGRLETLEAELDEQSSSIDPDVVDALKTDVEAVSTTVSELDSWVESEFDDIEQLFERLLATTTDHEERLHEFSTELETVSTQYQTMQTVHELQETAVRKGVSEGTCENCDNYVSLGLLTSPHCPSCGAKFTDVSRSGWNPFTSATIETESAAPSRPEAANDQ
jgi:rubrerythrin